MKYDVICLEKILYKKIKSAKRLLKLYLWALEAIFFFNSYITLYQIATVVGN